MFSLLYWYVVIGLAVALWVLYRHGLANYFAGGWQFKRLAYDVACNAALWPVTVYAIYKGEM